jgi:hypothetical protein
LTPFGVMATRYSSFLISLGTPTIMTPPRSSPDCRSLVAAAHNGVREFAV